MTNEGLLWGNGEWWAGGAKAEGEKKTVGKFSFAFSALNFCQKPNVVLASVCFQLCQPAVVTMCLSGGFESSPFIYTHYESSRIILHLRFLSFYSIVTNFSAQIPLFSAQRSRNVACVEKLSRGGRAAR